MSRHLLRVHLEAGVAHVVLDLLRVRVRVRVGVRPVS